MCEKITSVILSSKDLIFTYKIKESIMEKSFKTKFLSIFLSILMLFCMMPQIALADVETVIPDDYIELEAALRSSTPKIIEINKELTMNNEVIVGANHILSVSSGSAIYLAGSCKLNVPSGIRLTANGGGKLSFYDSSTISVNGTLTLEDIDFEMQSNNSEINGGKLTAINCNIKIKNSSGVGLWVLGELEITGEKLEISNKGDYTSGIVSFSDSPILISDCEVELKSEGKSVTAIQGDMYVKNSEVLSEVINPTYGSISEAIKYNNTLTFDNSRVILANRGYIVTGITDNMVNSELKMTNGSTMIVQYQGDGTGIFINWATSPDKTVSFTIDDSTLELYPSSYRGLTLLEGANLKGNNYGKIIFHEGSKTEGIQNKIKDRDVIVTSEYITVGPSSAPATASAISAGTYIWEGTHFSNTTVLPTGITFTVLQTGGASGTADSTGINISFSEDVTGFTEDKISITNGTGEAVKGTLNGSGKNYTISLTSVSTEGTVNLDIENFGSYRVTTPIQTVNIYKNTVVTPKKDISFTALQTGGASGTANSTGIGITFSEDVTGFTADKVSITDATGSVSKGALSGSGKNYTISLTSVATEGTVNLSIADFENYRVTTSVQTVNVYKNTVVTPKKDISFTALQTGGVSGAANSTGISITFSEDVTGFTADKISITNGTGTAVKGTLSGSGKNYTISLASVATEGTVNLGVADFENYRVTTPVQTVNVYKNTSGGNNSDNSGSSNSTSAKTDSNVVNGSTITVTAKEADGVITSNVDSGNISEAIKNADKSTENPVINIVIDKKENIDTIKTVISNDGWKQIAQSANMSLQIKFGSTIITLDNAAINKIYKQAKKDIIIQIGVADKTKLTTAQQNSIGENQTYDLSIISDNKVISELGGKVAVKLHYALKSGENADSIIIYHVDEDGVIKIVKNAVYNATTKTVDFNTSHFSIYMIDYNHTEFSDVTNEFWGKSAIDFSSARNLVSGVGNDKFEPNRDITRAEFTQMVYNVFELDTIDYTEFTDVKPESWYYTAIMSCKKAGFFEKLNLSDDEFKPNQAITREEMAVILSNVAKYCKISTNFNVVSDLTKFSDYDNVNKDFVDNIIFVINLGLLDKNGIGDSKFDPKGSTTRAQAAQIQKNMMYILDITK